MPSSSTPSPTSERDVFFDALPEPHMSSSDDDLPLQLLRQKYTSEGPKTARPFSATMIKEVQDFGAEMDSIMNTNGSWNKAFPEAVSPILTNRISLPPPVPTHYLDDDDDLCKARGPARNSIPSSGHSKQRIFKSTDGRTVYECSPYLNGNNGTTEELVVRTSFNDSHELKRKTSQGDTKVRRRSKLIEEPTTDLKTLQSTLTELTGLRRAEARAKKREKEANSFHAKTASSFKKVEADFLAARTRYEVAQSKLQTSTRDLETSQLETRDVKKKVEEKHQEVKRLREAQGSQKNGHAKLVGFGQFRRRSLWKK